jgi:hypothetical protein
VRKPVPRPPARNLQPPYYGKLRRWMPAIKRWRKAGLSWPSIGRLLQRLGVPTRTDRDKAVNALWHLALHAHKRMASERKWK